MDTKLRPHAVLEGVAQQSETLGVVATFVFGVSWGRHYALQLSSRAA